MKRTIDVFFSLVGLILLLPLLLAIAVLAWMISGSPVFYRGSRIGRGGRLFRILKFRSMLVDTEDQGGSATANGDPRVTPFGAILRANKLDEIPQLWNVLTGDMSLVGPRPEVPKFAGKYEGDEARILTLRPGITDWASIWNADEGSALAGSADPETTYEAEILPTKIRLQKLYLDNHSVWTDLRVLFYTAARLLHCNIVPHELSSLAPPGRPPNAVMPHFTDTEAL